MVHTGLVLQGGGALGAFEYGALLRLYEDPAFRPDIIAGVSIGAINAACLVGAKDDPLKTLQYIWDRFTVEAPWFVPPQGQRFFALFGNPHFFSMRNDYMASAFWTSFYRIDPLDRLPLWSSVPRIFGRAISRYSTIARRESLPRTSSQAVVFRLGFR